VVRRHHPAAQAVRRPVGRDAGPERGRHRLRRRRERQARDQALFQLFVRDPINGIKIELNFAAEEARRAGRRPTRTAADAAEEHPATTG
jgi:hypothetical protein